MKLRDSKANIKDYEFLTVLGAGNVEARQDLLEESSW